MTLQQDDSVAIVTDRSEDQVFDCATKSISHSDIRKPQRDLTLMHSLRRVLGRSSPGLLLLVLVTLWFIPATQACPFCLSPGQTWAEMVAEADAIVLAKIKTVFAGSDDESPWATLEIVKIHKGQHHLSGKKIGETIRVNDYFAGDVGDLYLLRGTLSEVDSALVTETFATVDEPVSAGSNIQQTSASASSAVGNKPVAAVVPESNTKSLAWDLCQSVTTEAYQYIIAAPEPKADRQIRLAYFHPYLEHSDSLIAADAWGEFAASDYADIQRFAGHLSADRLRTWIAAADTSPERLGMYGMMLGLCGDPSDAAFLMQQVGIGSATDVRFGVEGLMGGLLILTREDGLKFLEKTRLQNPHASSLECFAVVQALQFLREYEPSLVEKQRLYSAMYPLLERPELREIVIRDLARWQDWTIVGKLSAIYDQCPETEFGTISAITGYLIVCQKANAETNPDVHAAAG
ncbi:MAG: hypothetical protein KDA89_20945, partial [Planctomycetaceae bacterium]|nr:hypothetical protein [Planctomycetaceae bacterium]